MVRHLLRLGMLFLAAGAPPSRAELVDGTALPGAVVALSPSSVAIRIDDSEFLIPRSLLRTELPPGFPGAASPDTRPDRIVLTDGGLVLGQVVSETPDSVMVRRDSRERAIPRARIVSIDRGIAARPAPSAVELARGALERLADPDPLVAASARRTLAVLGGAARPLLEAELQKSDLAPASADILRELLGILPGAPAEETVPPGALRILFEAGAGEALLIERLGLTAAQRPGAREALAAASRSFGMALPRASTGERAEAAREIRALVDDFLARMRGLLTDVQFATLEEMLRGPR